MNRDDRILVRESLQGDRNAFEAIINRYEKMVYNVAFRILNNADDAADVTQSVFLNIYEHLNDYKPRFKFFSWIYRIAVNVSLNFQKQRKEGESVEEISSDGKQPDEILADEERGEIIQQALMRIGLDYRVVIILSYFQDLSYAEIAYVLDLPEKTVKSRLFTARKLLRDILLPEMNA